MNKYYGIRVKGPFGQMLVSGIGINGEVYFGYNTAVYKTRRGAQNAIDRAATLYTTGAKALEIFECNAYGRPLEQVKLPA